jgi:ribosome-binding protein aMBF1 (putative translation factor)
MVERRIATVSQYTIITVSQYRSMSKNRYTATESQAPDCQDWTAVSMNKSYGRPKPAITPSTSTSAPSSCGTNSASAVVAAITATSAKSDDEAKKTKYIAKVTSDAIRVARCEKKLTQKELAQKCNMDAAIVSEIERGGCVYQPAHVNKIQSVLGVKIPRA